MSKESKFNFRKAIDILLQDYIKDAIKSLLGFLGKAFWNIYGASLLLILSSLLLGLISWLKIPITLPAYVVGIGIATIILGVLIFQRLRLQLKSKQGIILYEELLWKLENDNVIGPLCPACKEKMTCANDQDTNAANIFFGKNPEYTFTCKNGHEVKRNKSTSEMIKSAQSLFSKKESQ